MTIDRYHKYPRFCFAGDAGEQVAEPTIVTIEVPVPAAYTDVRFGSFDPRILEEVAEEDF